MRNLINICFFFALSTSLGAQNLTGTITNEKGEFLYGATILWEGTDIGTVADENGFFELILLPFCVSNMLDMMLSFWKFFQVKMNFKSQLKELQN
jgi:hypothetical protein